MYEQEKGQMECGKITQVQNELTRTKKNVAEIDDMVMRLLGVLAPILRGGLEEVEPSNRVEKELVPLARELSDANLDLEINRKRLSQILDRLEL